MNIQKKIGYLLHVYHLEAEGWERLVWGEPERDRLGSGTKLIELLLSEPAEHEVSIIVYSGPSTKDGLTEGAYTKQFLLRKLASLHDFPRLHQRIESLPPGAYETFVTRLHNIVTGPVIRNTLAEVMEAVAFFASQGADTVTQVAVASHAARCMQNQTVARTAAGITPAQQWFVAASDVCFMGTEPQDVVVIEPPHRGDDPMTGLRPSLSEVVRPYFMLPSEDKKKFIASIANITTELSSTVVKL